jgi:transcriptional regulator with XRE-family HTH domain
MDWARRIKDYRSRNGLTQEAFAAHFGVDRTTVSRWENGREQPALVYRKRLQALTLSFSESIVRGLIDHIDGLDSTATLLDGEFRVLRTTRLHQSILKYDPATIYGRSCERYWSHEMEQVIKNLGGLRQFRKLGIYCMDLTIVRQPGEGEFKTNRALASVGRTVAVGDPRDPVAYLTTLRRLEEDVISPVAPVIQSLDGEI